MDGEKGKKVTEKLRGLEGPWRQQSDREEWLTDGEGCSSAGNEWDGSLGTIGARNHFAEIQVVESSSVTSVDGLSLHDNEVVLLVHSGSRGYGGYVLKKYTVGKLQPGSNFTTVSLLPRTWGRSMGNRPQSAH